MGSDLLRKLFFGAFTLCCLLQISTAPTQPTSARPATGKPPNQTQNPPPPQTKPKTTQTTNGNQNRFNDVLERGSSLFTKEFGNSDTLKKFFSIKFVDIPDNLKGTADVDLTYYVIELMRERRTIQRYMIYHMTQCWAVAVGSYFFANPTVFPVIKMIGIDDEGQRKSLEGQWSTHQDRMANFVLQYMQLKKLKPETLPRNAVGIPYLKVPVGQDRYEQLPVYIGKKGEQIPPFVKGISNSASRIMKTWWSAPDKQQ